MNSTPETMTDGLRWTVRPDDTLRVASWLTLTIMPPLLITSLQNQRVKDAAKLRDRRQREKQGRFLVDGVRELDRALDAGLRPDDVFVCPALFGNDATRQL